MRRPTIFEFLNKQPALSGKKVRLRPRGPEDAADEYRWRTDDELCRLDATVPLAYTFKEFLERYSLELEYPGLTCNLAIDTLDGMHIGDCSLFNISHFNDSAEVGIMIGDKKYWGQGYGADALLTFLSYIFQAPGVNKVLLRTLECNARAQKCFEKCGFKPCGSLIRGEHRFVLMEVERQQPL